MYDIPNEPYLQGGFFKDMQKEARSCDSMHK